MSCVWTCEASIRRNKKGYFYLQPGQRIIKCGKCEPCVTLKLAKYEAKLRNVNGS